MLTNIMRQSSCTIFVLFLVLLSGLSGCYQPLYGNKTLDGLLAGAPSASEERLNQIAIAAIPERDGQKLRNLLIDRFYIRGRPAKPETELRVNLISLEEKLGLQKDATSKRARYDLTATYQLIDRTSNTLVTKGQVRASVSYNILDNQYATLVGQQDASNRGVRDLAEQLTTRLLLYFNEESPKTQP